MNKPREYKCKCLKYPVYGVSNATQEQKEVIDSVLKNLKTIKLKPNQELVEFLKTAKEQYNKLPDWKKGILEASLKPFNDTPRKPIISDKDEY